MAGSTLMLLTSSQFFEEAMKVTCPRCKKKTEYSKENEFRPFCSKRCKEADLYGWLKDDDDEVENVQSEEEAMEELAAKMFGKECFPGSDKETKH